MASNASVLTNSSYLSRIDQQLHQWERWLALISGYAIFSLMVLAVISVSGRQFFNQPLPGYVDWIEQAMPLIAFMGISYTQRHGGHIRMDMLVGQLKGRFLWAFELLTTLAILILVCFLLWGTWAHFERSFDFNAPWWSRDSSIDIGIPLWPAKLMVPVAFFILVLRLLIQVWGYARALIAGATSPVAVPLIQDAEQQAKQEADQLG